MTNGNISDLIEKLDNGSEEAAVEISKIAEETPERAKPAIDTLIRVLRRTDETDSLKGKVVTAIAHLGPSAIQTADAKYLEKIETAFGLQEARESDEVRIAVPVLCNQLQSFGVGNRNLDDRKGRCIVKILSQLSGEHHELIADELVDKDLVDKVARAMESPSEEVSGSAVVLMDCLASHYPRKAEPYYDTIQEFTDHRKRWVREAADYAVSKIENWREYKEERDSTSESAESEIQSLIDDIRYGNTHERETAAAKISKAAKKGNEDVVHAIPELREALYSGESERFRGEAANALAEIGHANMDEVGDVKEGLLNLLDTDADEFSQLNGILGVVALGIEEAVKELERLESSKNRTGNVYVASRLAKVSLSPDYPLEISYEYIRKAVSNDVQTLSEEVNWNSSEDYAVAAIIVSEEGTYTGIKKKLAKSAEQNPEEFHDVIPLLEENIFDTGNNKRANYSMWALREYSREYPEQVTHLVDKIVPFLERLENPGNPAGLLEQISYVEPQMVAPHRGKIEKLTDHEKKYVRESCATILRNIEEIGDEDRRMTTDRFYGGVSNRLQNLLSMLEYVQKERPSRSELTEWVISETRANSEEAVSHHLTFLDSIGMIELSEDECGLGVYGSRYLKGEADETLYDALSSNVKGFDTILKNLSEESMTDEDIMDLLVSEFDEAEMMKPGPAIRHREWLQVLGFVEREDGVNRLTEKGKDFLEFEQENETTSTQNEERSTKHESVDLPDGQNEVKKREVSTTRAERDSSVVSALKELYENTCQVCGERRLKSDEEGFSEVHHIKPISKGGPDEPKNAIVVCPNHHVDFENGMLRIDPDSFEIEHRYEEDVSGTRLLVSDEHELDSKFIEYHNKQILSSD